MGSETPSSSRLSQADRSALSERRTLQAAVELMGELGYEKTTLAAIGEAAGYSRGLATHQFGSKAELFARVIQWISEKVRQVETDSFLLTIRAFALTTVLAAAWPLCLLLISWRLFPLGADSFLRALASGLNGTVVVFFVLFQVL